MRLTMHNDESSIIWMKSSADWLIYAKLAIIFHHINLLIHYAESDSLNFVTEYSRVCDASSAIELLNASRYCSESKTLPHEFS